MSFVIFLLYFFSALVLAYTLSRRFDRAVIFVMVLALFLAFDAQGWFLTDIFPTATEWPARSLADVFALAWRGVSTPTTVLELGLVAGGRLLAVLAVIYGAYFGTKYGVTLVRGVKSLALSNLTLMLLWAGSVVISFVIQAQRVDVLMPLASVLSLTAVFACLSFALNALLGVIKTLPSSRSEV